MDENEKYLNQLISQNIDANELLTILEEINSALDNVDEKTLNIKLISERFKKTVNLYDRLSK